MKKEIKNGKSVEEINHLIADIHRNKHVDYTERLKKLKELFSKEKIF